MRTYLLLLTLIAAGLVVSCGHPDPCAGVTCSGHGTCEVLLGAPACKCDVFFQAFGLSCGFPPMDAGVGFRPDAG